MSAQVVSVCIPTLQRLAYLKEAVASARNQTLPDIEILIGDDGDSRALADWALEAQAGDARVRYFPTPRRLGLAGNWNFLVRRARGEFCVLMGDDDRLLPTFVERLMREVRPQVSVVFCNHHLIDARGQRHPDGATRMEATYERNALPAGTLASPARAAWRNSIPMCASLVRTSELRRLEFKEDLNTPELEMFVRLAEAGTEFVFVPERLVEYRDHAGSETARGLTLGPLAEHLARVEVAPETEAAKRACLASLVSAGISSNLWRGDVAGARRLLELEWGPNRGWRTAFTRACVALPAPLGASAFRAAARLWRVGRRARHLTPPGGAGR